MIKKVLKVLIFVVFVLFASACSIADRQVGTSEGYTEVANQRFGLNGYYILKFSENANVLAGLESKKAGSSTASGEKYDPSSYTAAHKSLPFNTIVRISNLANGRSSEVRINDRVSNADKHTILLSQAVANDLDIKTNTHISLDIVAFALFSPDALPKSTLMATQNVPDTPSIRQDKVQNSVDTAPQTTPQTNIKPKNVAKKADQGEILVQIGAYSSQNNANRMQELYAKYYKYTAFANSCLNERLYCVYLSGFESVQEARYFIQTSPTWDNFIVVDDKVLEYSGRKDEPRDIYKERRTQKANKVQKSPSSKP